MANTFKVVTKASVSTDSSSPTTLYTVPSSTTAVILAILLANKTTTDVKATIILSSDTANSGASQNADVNLLKDVLIAKENSLEILAGQKYVLQTSDLLKIYADNANLDIVLSFMEMT